MLIWGCVVGDDGSDDGGDDDGGVKWIDIPDISGIPVFV
jgi:hypothetical protein